MKNLKYIVTSFLIVLIIWQLIVMLGGFQLVLFPSPWKVIQAFGELIGRGLSGSTSGVTLFGHIKASLVRFFIGYAGAVFFGVIFGLILGRNKRIFAYVNPILQLLRPIAPVAWLPFIVLLIGIGEMPAIAIIFIAGFFPIILSTVAAVERIDPTYLKVASNFGLTKRSTLFKIVFPSAFPQIVNSLHMALSTSWIFLVSAEMVGAQSGLGFLIMDAKNFMRADALLATMITIGTLGFLLDVGIHAIEQWVTMNFGFGTPKTVEKI